MKPQDPGSASYSRNLIAEHRTDRVILLIGLMLSIVGFCWLFPQAVVHGGQFRGLSCGVYGSALVLMYASATIFHWLPERPPRCALRILDHSAIYVLIAGTYTPFTLPNISAPWAQMALTLMWAMVIVGIIFKLLWIHRAKRISLIFYLAMSWSAIAFVQPLSAALPIPVLHALLLGGIFYTVGAFFYAWKDLPYRFPIWHLFVIAGSITHYVAVCRYLMV